MKVTKSNGAYFLSPDVGKGGQHAIAMGHSRTIAEEWTRDAAIKEWPDILEWDTTWERWLPASWNTDARAVSMAVLMAMARGAGNSEIDAIRGGGARGRGRQ